MRIAYIIPSLYRMAPNRVVQQLVEGMMARGHECHVLYFDPVTTDAMAFPCPVTRISLLRATDLTGYDVVHTHGLRPNLYVWIHGVPRGVKAVATITRMSSRSFALSTDGCWAGSSATSLCARSVAMTGW